MNSGFIDTTEKVLYASFWTRIFLLKRLFFNTRTFPSEHDSQWTITTAVNASKKFIDERMTFKIRHVGNESQLIIAESGSSQLVSRLKAVLTWQSAVRTRRTLSYWQVVSPLTITQYVGVMGPLSPHVSDTRGSPFFIYSRSTSRSVVRICLAAEKAPDISIFAQVFVWNISLHALVWIHNFLHFLSDFCFLS